MKRFAIAALAVLGLGAVIAGAQVVTNPQIPPNTVCAYNTAPPTLTNGQASWLQCDATGNLLTTASGGGGGTTSVQGAVNVTLTNCSGTIATGGTAQNAFTAAATRHGFTIANIDTTEVLWVSFTTTAAASASGSFPLGPADATTFSNLTSFTSPLGMGINTALSVVAATTAHKFTCTVW